ncbi:hypothetical protein CC86DRAFT_368836 [Ophiobolus disseminans]|uniref:Uncharacterized protein n=1 Tax=Ophiobolus disseminans TaxID=1469910 RepID=A0A6A7A7J1_9PLEO|nr:hypothetical protein CC86DRAFT_368836 [Ophiobolus disseminans]
MDPHLRRYLNVNSGAEGAHGAEFRELKTTLLRDRSNDKRRKLYAQVSNEPERVAELVEWETLFSTTTCFPSIAELCILADILVTQSFDDWEFVNRVVHRREDAIRKRWMEKTVEQRRQLLLRVEPDMA